MKKMTLCLFFILISGCQGLPSFKTQGIHLLNQESEDSVCKLVLLNNSKHQFSCTVYRKDPINYNLLKLNIENVLNANPKDSPLDCKFKNYRPLQAEATFGQNYSIDNLNNHHFTLTYKRPIKNNLVLIKFEPSGLHIKSHITVTCVIQDDRR